MIRDQIIKGWCRASLPLILAAAAACGHRDAKSAEAGPPPPAPTPAPATFESLSAELFQGRCLSCHSGAEAAAGVHLDDLATMTSPNDEGELVVAAGEPNDSLLVKVLEATDPEADPPRMPPAGPAVDASLAAKVRAWVASGAPAR